MLKKLLFTLILCEVLLLSAGCVSGSREQMLEGIKNHLNQPEPTKPSADFSSAGESWDKTGESAGNLFDDLTELASKVGSSIGDSLNDFTNDLGSAFGSDISNITDKDTEKYKGSASDKTENKKPTPTPVVIDKGAIVEDINSILDETGKGKEDKNEVISEEEKTYSIEGVTLEGPLHILKVVDGDTVKLKEFGSDVRFRLIGCDTPESVASDEYLASSGKENTAEGKDASAFMKEYLPKDSVVYIEYDVEHQDRYGRELVYLYAEKNGELVFINEMLLKEGLAKIFTLQPNVKYADTVFLKAQKYARKHNKGFWATGFCQLSAIE